MNPRTFGWFYKAGCVLLWPVIGTALIVLAVCAVALAWFLIPFAHVTQSADGHLTLHFGESP